MSDNNKKNQSATENTIEECEFHDICNVMFEEKIVQLQEKNKSLSKELQEEKIFSQQTAKMATLGEMLSTLVHELKNPITTIIGYSEILMNREGIPENAQHDIEVISRSSQRIFGLVDHLLKFSRQGDVSSWGAVDINESINDTLLLMYQQIKVVDIHVHLDLEEELPGIWGEPTLTGSIFQNLIINSRDAFCEIKDERKKVIEVSSKYTDEKSIVITYTDNASGIDDETLKRMFEPFFTTKSVGKGTGLGLATLKKIVDEMEGEIKVESKKGKGTTFIMTFPVFGTSI